MKKNEENSEEKRRKIRMPNGQQLSTVTAWQHERFWIIKPFFFLERRSPRGICSQWRKHPPPHHHKDKRRIQNQRRPPKIPQGFLMAPTLESQPKAAGAEKKEETLTIQKWTGEGERRRKGGMKAEQRTGRPMTSYQWCPWHHCRNTRCETLDMRHGDMRRPRRKGHKFLFF